MKSLQILQKLYFNHIYLKSFFHLKTKIIKTIHGIYIKGPKNALLPFDV